MTKRQWLIIYFTIQGSHKFISQESWYRYLDKINNLTKHFYD